jgi:hypothetical protein
LFADCTFIHYSIQQSFQFVDTHLSTGYLHIVEFVTGGPEKCKSECSNGKKMTFFLVKLVQNAKKVEYFTEKVSNKEGNLILEH